MVDYREILRLHSLDYSQRQIASSVRSSHHTVKNVLELAASVGISWPLDDLVANAELEKLFYPERQLSNSGKVEPDYAYIHKELARPGVTLTLLWSEYCEQCYSSDQTPYMSTQFCDKYRLWARLTKATMRIQHKPGEAIQVDWAGNTIPVYDSVTGDTFKAYLFVAVLQCSCYAYVEACSDMKSENWLLCHVHERCHNVPRALGSCDSEWFHTGCWILRRFSDCPESTIGSHRQNNCNRLPDFIHREKLLVPRRSAYLEEEQEFMLPLPATAYEPAVWTQAQVGSDYLVSDGRNKYSVSFDLIGETVDIRLTKNTVEAFFHGNRVASHPRKAAAQRDPMVKPEHMTPEHRTYLNYNSDDFTAWAVTIGEETAKVVRCFLTSGKAPEQGYKACASLTKLADRYGHKRLESACERVLTYSATPTVRNISTILKNGQDKIFAPKETMSHEAPNSYGITRGASYFRKGGASND